MCLLFLLNRRKLLANPIIPETIKRLEENIGSKLLDIGLVDDFLNLTPKQKQQKQK